jgi:hypothetical protein
MQCLFPSGHSQQMNLGFKLYFPILEKEISDKLLCGFFNKTFGDFFKYEVC